MAFDDDLKRALRKNFPKSKVVFGKGWRTRGSSWRTKSGKPVAHLVHHTAGAVTDSRNPKNPGNQKGANAGIVTWCYNYNGNKGLPNTHGFCNAVIDRDGTVYIVGAKSQWHAGLGAFSGTRWEKLGIPKDQGNTAMFGTEMVSKGLKRDFTKAQMESLNLLNVSLREACDWPGFQYRIMNHRDWAGPRKNDTKYRWQRFVSGARKAWSNRAK